MSRLYVQHDYAVTGRDYVETDGGDTPGGDALPVPGYSAAGDTITLTSTNIALETGGWYIVTMVVSNNPTYLYINDIEILATYSSSTMTVTDLVYIPAGSEVKNTGAGTTQLKLLT